MSTSKKQELKRRWRRPFRRPLGRYGELLTEDEGSQTSMREPVSVTQDDRGGEMTIY